MSTPLSLAPTQGVARSLPGAALSIAVGIPTRGRPAILKETLADLALQTHLPAAILVAYAEPADIGDAAQLFPAVGFLQAPPAGGTGSCAQRNRLLTAAGDTYDLILIMDDDCYLQRDYLRRTAEVFAADPAVVGTTGRILENGARGAGLTIDHARQLLGSITQVPTLAERPPLPAFNTDGCNMVFRTGVIARHGIRFDEAMPGYAWFEDIDFSRRMLPYGTLKHVPGAQAVHLGAKVGKTSGLRYGYSQVANPIYLVHKGTYFWPRTLDAVGRNLAANLLRSLRPEPFIDRRGRLRGNLLAFYDLLRGRLHPARILEL